MRLFTNDVLLMQQIAFWVWSGIYSLETFSWICGFLKVDFLFGRDSGFRGCANSELNLLMLDQCLINQVRKFSNYFRSELNG